jgi:hypothetical protein
LGNKRKHCRDLPSICCHGRMLPAPTVDPNILQDNLDMPPGPITKSTQLLFHYLRDKAFLPPVGQQWNPPSTI